MRLLDGGETLPRYVACHILVMCDQAAERVGDGLNLGDLRRAEQQDFTDQEAPVVAVEGQPTEDLGQEGFVRSGVVAFGERPGGRFQGGAKGPAGVEALLPPTGRQTGPDLLAEGFAVQ